MNMVEGLAGPGPDDLILCSRYMLAYYRGFRT